LSLDDFRKEFPCSKEKSLLLHNLTIPPTNLLLEASYGFFVSIGIKSKSERDIGGLSKGSGPEQDFSIAAFDQK